MNQKNYYIIRSYLFFLEPNGKSKTTEGITNISAVFQKVGNDGLHFLGSSAKIHHLAGEIHALFHQRQILSLK